MGCCAVVAIQVRHVEVLHLALCQTQISLLFSLFVSLSLSLSLCLCLCVLISHLERREVLRRRRSLRHSATDKSSTPWTSDVALRQGFSLRTLRGGPVYSSGFLTPQCFSSLIGSTSTEMVASEEKK